MQEELDKLRRLSMGIYIYLVCFFVFICLLLFTDHNKTIRLKQLGLDPDDLPSAFREQLTEFTRIRNATGLLRLNDISLEQWYQDNKLECIDRTIDLAKLKISTGQMESQLATIVKESQDLSR